MAKVSPTDCRCPVAYATLRWHSLESGRRLIGLGLGVMFLLLGGGALVKEMSGEAIARPPLVQTEP